MRHGKCATYACSGMVEGGMVIRDAFLVCRIWIASMQSGEPMALLPMEKKVLRTLLRWLHGRPVQDEQMVTNPRRLLLPDLSLF